ncbi:MAG: hypothetical protein A4S17_08430 [Proteobacteria bacterium HN_bin10]|jgi:hypothetical protein|nr:MAG: hypothetical protein A4S17_08430 [Proteobacteria bacterium HN_bin10]
MTQKEYWFARRFPLGDRRRAVAPVHWKGYVVAIIFAVALCIGGVAFAWMGASGYLMQGIVVFALAALVGGGWFITVANAKADHTRTVADYQKDKPQRV